MIVRVVLFFGRSLVLPKLPANLESKDQIRMDTLYLHMTDPQPPPAGGSRIQAIFVKLVEFVDKLAPHGFCPLVFETPEVGMVRAIFQKTIQMSAHGLQRSVGPPFAARTVLVDVGRKGDLPINLSDQSQSRASAAGQQARPSARPGSAWGRS